MRQFENEKFLTYERASFLYTYHPDGYLVRRNVPKSSNKSTVIGRRVGYDDPWGYRGVVVDGRMGSSAA